jgi:glycosyltransferase involved in cell wall biosynthesis
VAAFPSIANLGKYFRGPKGVTFSGISTILPVYLPSLDSRNLTQLQRAVDSVLTQECALPIELIVVDDGSAAAVCEHPALATIFRRQNVISIRLPKNQGLVFALNAGLTRARHDLIARIDADDYWRPGKLAQQLAAFSRDPDLSIIGTAMRLVHLDSARDCDHVRGTTWQHVLDFYADVGCPFPHGSILARKDVYTLLGGYPHDPRYRHCEDFALWGRWVRFFKCAMLEEVLFEYSISGHQISTRYFEEQRLAAMAVHRAFLDLANHRQIPGAVAEIANFLKRPLLETGKILFVAWQYYTGILVDSGIYEAAKILMPDRRIHRRDDAGNVVADRLFYIGDSMDCEVPGRRVHDIGHIRQMLGGSNP